LLVFALNACAVRTGFLGDDVNGADVQRTIDTRLSTILKSESPKLAIAASRCPAHIDVSNGKVAYCTLDIDDVAIPVRVVYRTGGPQSYAVDLGGFIFAIPDLERTTNLLFRVRYGFHVSTHCGSPKVRLYRPGTIFRCPIVGLPNVSTIRFRTVANGQVFTYNPPGLQSETSRWLSLLLKEYNSGAITMASGAEAAKFIDSDIKIENAVAPSLHQVGRVRCPPSIELTGRKRGICLVSADGKDLRVSVWIDRKDGFKYRPLDEPIDMQHIAETATQDLNRRLIASGNPGDALVGCGTGIVIVHPPTKFYCALRAGGGSGRLEVEVYAQGGLRWRGVDMRRDDSSSSASP
jgi:hypothetical protein